MPSGRGNITAPRCPWPRRLQILAHFDGMTRYGMMQGPLLSIHCAMPREAKHKQQHMRARIAAAAARIMAEDGVEDFALAKRKAARQLGAEDTQALPRK